MPNLLRIRRIDEISLVDKGASGNARVKPAIVIAKRRADPMTKEQIEAVVKVLKAMGYKVEKAEAKKDAPTMTIDEVLGSLTPDQKAVVLAALQAAAAKELSAPPKKDEPAPKEPDATGDEPKKEPPMLKRADLPEDVRKALDEGEAAKKESAELKKRLDGMVDKQEAADFLAKASDLKYLAGASTVEISKALRAAKNSLDEKEYATVVKLLESANEAVRTSKLLRAPGTAGGDDAGGDATAKMDGIAKKLVADGKAKDYKQALSKAMRENPEIYSEYKAELEARARSH